MWRVVDKYKSNKSKSSTASAWTRLCNRHGVNLQQQYQMFNDILSKPNWIGEMHAKIYMAATTQTQPTHSRGQQATPEATERLTERLTDVTTLAHPRLTMFGTAELAHALLTDSILLKDDMRVSKCCREQAAESKDAFETHIRDSQGQPHQQNDGLQLGRWNPPIHK
jgi:hypothetical protein